MVVSNGAYDIMRIKLTIEYDGTNFCGWQFQPGLRTVQSELEEAIKKLTGEQVRVTASGRTDAGVHALGQVAHFDTEKDLGSKYSGALNYYLPPDIRIIKAEKADESFHARFSAKNKTYKYVIYESEVDSALLRKKATRVSGKLNASAMNKAAQNFMGKNDFAAFMSTGSETSTTVRTITDISVKRKDGFIIISVSADGFLYNMVRKIAAALIKVGKGTLGGEDIKNLLKAGATFSSVAPAEGLYLFKVEYKNE